MNCKICGNEIEFNFDKQTITKMCKKRLCFDCMFWDEKVLFRKNKNPKVFVANGRHYYIGEETEQGFRGFAGHKFKVKFTQDNRKGITVTTTNLWCQGKVPKCFKNKLTDNAVFINSKEPKNGN